ncbi:MAG: serine--tRNA ligase, partial [Candidatus Omnitrophica bacterium]|nr:serine--tRNA ligase [Candidatus Omnitrophota bacterium]
MLDLKFIRENLELVEESLRNRNLKLDLSVLVKIDDKRRDVLLRLENLRAKRNKANDEVGALLKEEMDAKEKINSMKSISLEIGQMEDEVKAAQESLDEILIKIPNIAHASVPVGDLKKNSLVRTWGNLRKFDFKPLSHIDIAQGLDIIDFNRATKITGSNFILYKGLGAKLERALINFMLDLHTKKHGYTEIWP